MALEFLKTINIDSDTREQVAQAILSTKMPQKPTNQLENIICDGDLFHLGKADFREKGKLMHKEVELLYTIHISKKEWLKKDLLFFISCSIISNIISLLTIKFSIWLLLYFPEPNRNT